MTTTLVRRSLAGLLVATTVALAACGGGDDDTDDTDGTTAPAEETDGPEATDGPETTARPAETDAPVDSAVETTTEEVEGFLFTPPEGDYSVVFPGEPRSIDQEIPLPDGTTLPFTFHTYESDNGAFGTAAITYPDGTTTSLQGAIDGAVGNVDGTLLSQEPISQQGREGAEIVATVADGQGTYLSRFFLDGLELHQVIAVVEGDDASFDDPEIAAFFDSFEFTEDR